MLEPIAIVLPHGGDENAHKSILISSDANGAASVFAADVDGDGDMDVLSASADADMIAWHENTDGAGSFGAPQAISLVVPRGP